MKTGGQAENQRILVIDDNPSIHEDFRSILAGSGNRNDGLEEFEAALFGEKPGCIEGPEFAIDSAFQGKEGLLKVQQAVEAGRPYAVAFVDMRMPPGWDGVETISRIWKTHPDLQIVICTAFSDYSREEMIRQIGKSDSMVIIKKPFENIEVLQLAQVLAAKWRLGEKVKHLMSRLEPRASQRTKELVYADGQLREEGDRADRADEANRIDILRGHP